MNAFLNRFLDRKTRLYELFQQVDKALSRIRHNENGVDSTSNYTKPIIIIGLAKIKKHAATILTREIFESSNSVYNTLERLDPQIQNNQFKLYNKQLMCGK